MRGGNAVEQRGFVGAMFTVSISELSGLVRMGDSEVGEILAATT